MARFVLAHSPLTTAAVWGGLPDALRARGHEVVVIDVRDDGSPPYAMRYVARGAVQVTAAVGTLPVVLVGHSGAGYLLPQLGAARRAARAAVAAYVFLDAGIPHGREATRLALLHAEDPALAVEVEATLRAGGSFPPPDGDGQTRPRGLDFFLEPLPFPADWPDAPCGLLQLTPAYDRPARVARSRGWPVVTADLAGGHFAASVEPVGTADALELLLSQL